MMTKGFAFALCLATVGAGLFLLRSAAAPAAALAQAAGTPPPANAAPRDPGAASYASHCAVCHGAQREGNLPAFPPLVGITRRMTPDGIVALVHTGRGRMPAFHQIEAGELNALVAFLGTGGAPQQAAQPAPGGAGHTTLSGAGAALFQQNCAFCHGRDAQGGETGPDLTQSRLVRGDRTGEDIARVIHEGRPNNRMPAFNLSAQEIRGIIAFIHERQAEAVAHPGGRRGVAVADLQTGSAEAGRRYFNGAGGCSRCHSPTGDLAGIASRFEGLELEERLLYPRDATRRVTVTTPSGERLSGVLAYNDEFTLAMRDGDGAWHSWRVENIRYTIDSPVDAHVELFGRYTDDDIHNLMAYLQTLH